jgi:DNA-binding CsgD family transcriptional regulator
MFDTTFGSVFVILCDWRGICVWTSEAKSPVAVGELLWSHLTTESQREAKLALSQGVTLREKQRLEVDDQEGRRFRSWLWPLDSPETAVCILGLLVPRTIEMLTERERRCLELLAEGLETQRIAKEFDVSLSTVHTHLKNARKKLRLRNLEALISFAARYFFPLDRGFDWRPGDGTAVIGARPK